jgi:peroxiredoxin
VSVLSQLGLWLLTVVNLILILVLYRQFGLAAMSTAEGHDSDGIALGKKAPPLLLQTASGQRQDQFRPNEWMLILFGTTHCEPCLDALAIIRARATELRRSHIHVVAALMASPEDVGSLERDDDGDLVDLLVDEDGTTSNIWGVTVMPFAFLVSPQGVILRKGLVGGETRIRVFLDQATSDVSKSVPDDTLLDHAEGRVPS